MALTPTQQRALREVQYDGFPPITTRTSTLTRIRELGLIEWTHLAGPHPSGNSQAMYRLTPAGQAEFDRISAQAKED